MKIYKKIISLVLAIFTILTIISCGVNNSIDLNKVLVAKATTAAQYGAEGFGIANAKMVAETAIAVEDAYDAEVSYTTSLSGNNANDRKIIKTVDLNTETKTFDDSIEWLKSYINSFDGIIDNSYIDTGNMNNNYKNYRKSAYFNVRVPAEKLDSFLNKIGDKLNITFRQENISDITEEYFDTEARLSSLKIEEKSLNDMLKKAKTVEEMIKVEDKLSSVRTEIENITRRLKRYDKQVTYSTVSINIIEVKDLTEPETLEEDYSRETLIKQLNKNFEAAKSFVIRLGVNIFTHIPWIVLGLVALLIIMLILVIFKAIFGRKSKIKIKQEVNNDKKIEETDKKKEEEVEVEFYQ